MTLTLDAPRIVETRPLLEVHGVSKSYGPVQAVRNVSAHAYPGEVLGIVGESGSGKSTLLRMMNLEEIPEAGSYTLDLADVSGNLFELDRFARRMLCATRIGIVYQNPHLGLLMKHSSSGNVAEAAAGCWRAQLCHPAAGSDRSSGRVRVSARPP